VVRGNFFLPAAPRFFAAGRNAGILFPQNTSTTSDNSNLTLNLPEILNLTDN
jgi:hypothetical protein